jgi:putative hemolysin
MREAVQWLKQGGIIGVFPAGEVASLDLRYARVVEAEWSVHIARLIRLGQAAALPIYFHGTNSLLFHLSGLVHPMLRTALLPRESLKRRRTPIRVVVGNSIPFKRLTSFQKDTDMVDYLKKRTFLLKHRPSDKKVVPARVLGKIDSTVQAATAILHKFEIESLPSNQRLLQVGELEVYFANADQIPMGLLEIGRLREITFREVGEGSGLPVDIDRFDNHYIHLFIWNRARTEFVGAYRMGKTDEIFRRFGKNGLYTSTLFDYREELMERLNPALELGRSWVRKEYQKSSIALALLWRGICTYVVANPRYHRLFGPVSLSNDYHNISHQLIVHFVRKHCFHDDFARHLKSFQPFKPRLPWNMRRNIQLETMEDLSALVSDLETDGKGVPVLLKEYVKFGGKILGFNIDHEFGSVVDGLVMVDLLETNPRLLERYMGKTGKAAFLAHYGIEETVSFPVPEISAEAS